MGIYKYDPLLMDAKQVAVYLALSRPAVYRMSEQGNLPAPLRFGTLLRWRKSDIEAVAEGGWPRGVELEHGGGS